MAVEDLFPGLCGLPPSLRYFLLGHPLSEETGLVKLFCPIACLPPFLARCSAGKTPATSQNARAGKQLPNYKACNGEPLAEVTEFGGERNLLESWGTISHAHTTRQLFIEIKSCLYRGRFRNLLKIGFFDPKTLRPLYYGHLAYHGDILLKMAFGQLVNYAIEKLPPVNP